MKVAALVLATAISALSQESVSTNKVVTSTNVAVAAAQNFAPVAAESGPSAGTHAAALQAMFGERTNPIALPKVIAGSTISAAEVLRKALDARGGAVAASRILSFRAKGTIDLNHSLLAVSPVEYVAKRPNQYRMMIDLKMAGGSDIGRIDRGFDGKHGWDMEPGGPVRVIGDKMMLEAGVQDAAGMFEVMKAMRVTSGPSRTLGTTVMDLNARTFEVRNFKEFERKYEFKF
jgi:hypothetical protein